MKFIDSKHREFWNEKYKEMQIMGKTDVYYKAIVYTLGICETTRDNFNKIFNLRTGEINIDSINGAYQTSTSEKVTRMAFSLWNRCNYDSEKDIENEKVSEKYNVSEIFCCSYAPYFWEGIKIRYPEYTREQQIDKGIQEGRAIRTGSVEPIYYNLKKEVKNEYEGIEQLDYYVEEEIESEYENMVALYMRSGEQDSFPIYQDIEAQKIILESFCEKNNFHNIKKYIDIRKSGISEDRKALEQMKKDIDEGIIDKVIVTSPTKLYRSISKLNDLITFSKENFVEIHSVDQGAENTNLSDSLLQTPLIEEIKKELKEEIKKEVKKEIARKQQTEELINECENEDMEF